MATPGNLGSSVLASKTKTKKKHFVAQKVKLFRASDPLLSVLMWGVNHSHSVGRHLLLGASQLGNKTNSHSSKKRAFDVTSLTVALSVLFLCSFLQQTLRSLVQSCRLLCL
ncbi:Phosphatidylinositol-5-phosphate 4-kinase type-2 alpha [Myotis davidii]|uniref:Phosphatidylinositol-5-phosphate 4-kinase type-2 alpha n=1 Tax=Myotis davidii TaxID=225400 RepID=L5M2D9_MYODS|nr:Phosphatidylinositol-5-phosphate 4-kinase type-2 alpha [Myotis davidii]